MPTPTPNNSYQNPNHYDTDDNDKTIITSNCSQNTTHLAHHSDHTATTVNNNDNIPTSYNIAITTDTAIADSGTTGHFLLPHVKVRNKRKAITPITITYQMEKLFTPPAPVIWTYHGYLQQ